VLVELTGEYYFDCLCEETSQPGTDIMNETRCQGLHHCVSRIWLLIPLSSKSHFLAFAIKDNSKPDTLWQWRCHRQMCVHSWPRTVGWLSRADL
jgi:hypothetical protein